MQATGATAENHPKALMPDTEPARSSLRASGPHRWAACLALPLVYVSLHGPAPWLVMPGSPAPPRPANDHGLVPMNNTPSVVAAFDTTV